MIFKILGKIKKKYKNTILALNREQKNYNYIHFHEYLHKTQYFYNYAFKYETKWLF